MKTIKKYPVWICFDCGCKYYKGIRTLSRVPTSHEGHCDVCGRMTFVTEPRDFGHIDERKIKVDWKNDMTLQPARKKSKKMVVKKGVSEMNKSIKRFLQYGKCGNCKKGDFSKCCQDKQTQTWVKFANHKKKYFCSLGCAILFLDQKHSKCRVFDQAWHTFTVGGIFQ